MKEINRLNTMKLIAFIVIFFSTLIGIISIIGFTYNVKLSKYNINTVGYIYKYFFITAIAITNMWLCTITIIVANINIRRIKKNQHIEVM